MNRSVIAVIWLAFMLVACEHPQSERREIVARVGDAELTRAEVLQSIDTTQKPLEQQMQQYISSWTKIELLYQEAVRRGIENSPLFQQHLNETRRQLAVHQLLDDLQKSDTGTVSDDTLQAYFEQHSTEFFIREQMMKLNIMGFTSRDKANSFAAHLARGNSWEQARTMFLAEGANDVVYSTEETYCSERTILFPELWKVALTLGKNDVSFPVRIDKSYYIVQMLFSVNKGGEPTFDLVKEETRARYMRERQQQQIDSLVGTLRKHSTVEILLPVSTQSDTTLNSTHD